MYIYIFIQIKIYKRGNQQVYIYIYRDFEGLNHSNCAKTQTPPKPKHLNSIGSTASKNTWNQKSSGPIFKKSAMLTDFASSCRASTKSATSSSAKCFSFSAGLSPPTKLILVPGGCEYSIYILRPTKMYEGMKHIWRKYKRIN